jgi:small-conductance mechanosensitive channel
MGLDIAAYLHSLSFDSHALTAFAVTYGGAAAFAIVVYWAFAIGRDWLVDLLRRYSRGSVPEVAAAVLARTSRISIAVAALALSAAAFGMWRPWIGVVLSVAMMVQIGLWLSLFLNMLIVGYASRHSAGQGALANAVSLVRVLVEVAVWSIVLLVVFSTLGINVTAMVAGLGIGGIAIGLAAQGIFADLFSSLAIVFDRPFVQGDFVVFGDKAGTVENVGIKSTRLRALTGEQLVLSNANLLSQTIHNYQKLRERRILFGFGVTYQTPYALMRQIPLCVRKIVSEIESARFDRCHFKALGDSALEFEVVYFVLDADYNRYMDIQQTINLELMRQFEDMGIEFAYPTQTLFFAGGEAKTNRNERRAA